MAQTRKSPTGGNPDRDERNCMQEHLPVRYADTLILEGLAYSAKPLPGHSRPLGPSTNSMYPTTVSAYSSTLLHCRTL